jgi:trehalose 6-phosphate phosphatase
VPHDGAHAASSRVEPPPPLDIRAHALFLDLDGTLVDIAARPEDVIAGDSLRTLLRRLAENLDGALALITGRTIESAEAVLGDAAENIAGLHGFECRFNGEITRAHDDLSAVANALKEAKAMVADGVLRARIEDKTAGLALHYRDDPSAGPSVRRIAETLAEKHGLSVLEGKMVAELTFGVRNKGDALTAFMQEASFKGRIPIAIGDDVTDEDAFRAAANGGGYGIRVGDLQHSAARFRFADTAAVIAWLETGVAA